ncbi:hypothetical protein B0H16DRAFT_1715334 [Mycena metata]|uniref:Uncharacterized protein n=1 Tax=Mycena metata TaxID=1033252 RepID=A0AAD7NQS6_9AGAR|nr:hypothetical protein B0H16DRAFT_1715334 [Mycena metata]
MSSSTNRSVVVVDVKRNAWLMIKNSRAVSPIIVPTSELATGELTTTPEPPTELTRAEKQAQEDRALDLLFANNYFERIGRRQRIHKYAILQHLKSPTKSSLRLVIETFDTLYQSEMQVPPLLPQDGTFDAKVAVACDRALAFAPGTAEAKRAWAYGYAYTDGEAAERYHFDGEAIEHASANSNPTGLNLTNTIMSTDARRYDALETHQSYPRSSTGASNLEDAMLTLERIQNIARRLRPEQDCPYTKGADEKE